MKESVLRMPPAGKRRKIGASSEMGGCICDRPAMAILDPRGGGGGSAFEARSSPYQKGLSLTSTENSSASAMHLPGRCRIPMRHAHL